MALQFWIAEDLATCQVRLHHYAKHNSTIELSFLENRGEPGALQFAMRRRDSQVPAVTPRLRGMLIPDQGQTCVSAEFYPTEPIVGLFSLFFLALVGATACGVSSHFVVAQRADALGYGLVPNVFPFLLLGLPCLLLILWSMWLIEQADQRYLLQALTSCFAQTMDEQLLEDRKRAALRNQIVPLLKSALILGSVALLLGALVGMTAAIEDYLPPLKVTLSAAQVCSGSAADGSPVQQTRFPPTADIYVCGDLGIEIVDQRKIAIPLNFTWHDARNEEEASAVAYTFESAGTFAALLDKPASGTYRPGTYLVTVARGKAQLARLQFEVVE